jgi:DNA-directed RNA polymerase II subunit RPB3
MLLLNVACHDHHTMDITSNHLDIVPPGASDTWGSPEDVQDHEAGEELSKRGERFGRPVGKGAVKAKLSRTLWLKLSPKDDPSVAPVLICKIRKGQELKLKCVAKKVLITILSASLCLPHLL